MTDPDPLARARTRLHATGQVPDDDLDSLTDTLATMEGLVALLAADDGDTATAHITAMDRDELEGVCLLAVAALEGARRAHRRATGR